MPLSNPQVYRPLALGHYMQPPKKKDDKLDGARLNFGLLQAVFAVCYVGTAIYASPTGVQLQ